MQAGMHVLGLTLSAWIFAPGLLLGAVGSGNSAPKAQTPKTRPAAGKTRGRLRNSKPPAPFQEDLMIRARTGHGRPRVLPAPKRRQPPAVPQVGRRLPAFSPPASPSADAAHGFFLGPLRARDLRQVQRAFLNSNVLLDQHGFARATGREAQRPAPAQAPVPAASHAPFFVAPAARATRATSAVPAAPQRFPNRFNVPASSPARSNSSGTPRLANAARGTPPLRRRSFAPQQRFPSRAFSPYERPYLNLPIGLPSLDIVHVPGFTYTSNPQIDYRTISAPAPFFGPRP